MRTCSVFFASLLTLAIAGGWAQAKTELTGDIIYGKPLIAKLDVDSLEGGKVHKFYFLASQTNIGHGRYIPIMVAKGTGDGPRLLLNASVHGDELNGIAVIERVFAELDPGSLRGSVIAVPGVNPSGMLHDGRFFRASSDGGATEDLNRLAPGDAESSNPAERHNYNIWSKIYDGNIDYAIDMHTQSRGTDFPLFVYADFRNPKIRRMAELLQPEMLKIDEGAEGTYETTFVEAGIPALTYEIGGPKKFQWDYIDHAERGIRNIMVDLDMLDGEIEDLGTETFVGNELGTVRAQVGGFMEVLVELKEKVSKGQRVAVQRNAFGEVEAEYEAPFDGRVLSLATDPIREPGLMVVRLMRMNGDESCRYGC